jgi:hypothetical protein
LKVAVTTWPGPAGMMGEGSKSTIHAGPLNPSSGKSNSTTSPIARLADKIGKVYVMELTSNTTSDRKVKWNGKDHTYSICDEQIIPARTRIASLS